MNEHDDVLCQLRESLSELRMGLPVESIYARSRARRRRLSGLTAATAATAAGVATAMTLTLGGPAPARSGSPQGLTLGGPTPARSGSPTAPSRGAVTLAAFSVTSGPGDSTTLILRKGPQYPPLDPGELRRALARHGIPALVTVGTICRLLRGGPTGVGKVVRASDLLDGSNAIVIDGRAMPPGTRLSIGLFPGHARMLLIGDGAPLACGNTSRQPAVHIAPSGIPIRG